LRGICLREDLLDGGFRRRGFLSYCLRCRAWASGFYRLGKVCGRRVTRWTRLRSSAGFRSVLAMRLELLRLGMLRLGVLKWMVLLLRLCVERLVAIAAVTRNPTYRTRSRGVRRRRAPRPLRLDIQ
jgi:hypothetical protein